MLFTIWLLFYKPPPKNSQICANYHKTCSRYRILSLFEIRFPRFPKLSNGRHILKRHCGHPDDEVLIAILVTVLHANAQAYMFVWSSNHLLFMMSPCSPVSQVHPLGKLWDSKMTANFCLAGSPARAHEMRTQAATSLQLLQLLRGGKRRQAAKSGGRGPSSIMALTIIISHWSNVIQGQIFYLLCLSRLLRYMYSSIYFPEESFFPHFIWKRKSIHFILYIFQMASLLFATQVDDNKM